MMGTISNAQKDLIVSGLRNQINILQDLVNQLEDKSMIKDGPGWNYEDIANVESALRRIRKIIQKYESE